VVQRRWEVAGLESGGNVRLKAAYAEYPNKLQMALLSENIGAVTGNGGSWSMLEADGC
jgi:hypothetical protein